MKSPIPHKFGRRHESGIALVVVLLFTIIVLTIVVTTTATLALGARGGGVNERTAYEALLASESGHNTFAMRASSLPAVYQYRGNFTAAELEAWLSSLQSAALATGDQSINLRTFPSGASGTATLKFEAATGTNVSLGVTGTTSSGATKVVLQDYERIPTPAYFPSEAPLKSYSNVNVKANAQVIGSSGETSSGMTTVATVNQPGGVTIPASESPPSVSMNLTPTLGNGKLLLAVGNYVQLGNDSSIRYKVGAVAGNQVTLTALKANTLNITIVNSSEVKRLDVAVAETSAASTQISDIKVSDPSMFNIGSTVYVKNSANPPQDLKGQVTAINAATNTLSVQWTTPLSTTPITEGTPIRYDVRSVVSGYDITGDTTNIPNGSSPNDSRMRDMNPFNPASNPDLFTYTFKQTKNQMLAATPYSGWLQPKPDFANSGYVSGLTFYDGTLNLSGSKNLCGAGILIVKGNLTVNGTCPEGFRGVIYVMGDYDQQGNSVITGSVIAEGADQSKVGTECVANPTGTGGVGGNECDTQIAGTGQGTGKIIYDRATLLEMGSLIAPPTFKAVQGTWRQR